MTFNLILAVPPILYLVLFFFFAPESPHYLIKAKGEEETRKALIKLGRNKEGVQLELTELIAAQKEDDNSGSLLDIFRWVNLFQFEFFCLYIDGQIFRIHIVFAILMMLISLWYKIFLLAE